MDGEIFTALYDLKKSVDKQIELQEQTNIYLERLDEAIRGASQELADFRESIAKE